MNVLVYSINPSKNKILLPAINEYSKRIKYFVNFKFIEVKSLKLEHIKKFKNKFIFALDEEGELLNSGNGSARGPVSRQYVPASPPYSYSPAPPAFTAPPPPPAYSPAPPAYPSGYQPSPPYRPGTPVYQPSSPVTRILEDDY